MFVFSESWIEACRDSNVTILRTTRDAAAAEATAAADDAALRVLCRRAVGEGQLGQRGLERREHRPPIRTSSPPPKRRAQAERRAPSFELAASSLILSKR